MRRLPPLTAVEAFVQVAQLGSVKAAAEELALSSPALSRRIQAFERFIGRPLFDRRHQAMVLNSDGEQLLSRIAPPLDALSVAIDEMMGDADLLRLRLSTQPLFAAQRILPILPTLRARYPELHIDIDTQPYPLARLGEGIDAAIVMAREIDPAFYSRRVAHGRIAAIGASTMKEGPDALREPADIARATILVHRDMAELFTHWREAVGEPDLEPLAIDHFDSGPLMLEAAAQGLGVAFMLQEHVELAHDSRLINLFEDKVDSSYSYWFASRRSALSKKAVRLFHDWLFEAVADPEA
ncbi:LysR family glycine cleavage system transcriptional activator [Sphingomonas vulcanisoli]|uniref:LysR family glycine cleavage system transcriptional activator n=1 Tax=Sphingomonas vulcanisoli TaxID=1658060 RepID=A0ABX0TYQ4_9SPHN|nr:LysR substrate-binding domain-containing protein [Sphingomonas vulcanisoli]NIJ09510.1 LysR family glycine cleavage system transcriptional activator [Sphingomonas vulcanisoli]